MTAREYLSQAYLLEQRIASDIRKAESVRALASSLSLPAADTVRVSASPSGEASFIRILEKAEAIEERIAAEVNLLLNLQEQMERVIRTVPGEDLRLILSYRYMEHRTWPEIAESLHISRNTARARHETALNRIILPEDLIDISGLAGNNVLPAAAW